ALVVAVLEDDASLCGAAHVVDAVLELREHRPRTLAHGPPSGWCRGQARRYHLGAAGALPKRFRGSAGTKEWDCRPAVTGHDRAVRAERLAEWAELLGCGRGVELPGQGVALANAEVVDRPDVEPPQLEHQVHLRCPAADTADGAQPADQPLVAQSRARAEDDCAVEHLGGEVAKRGELVRRQAGGPECG